MCIHRAQPDTTCKYGYDGGLEKYISPDESAKAFLGVIQDCKIDGLSLGPHQSAEWMSHGSQCHTPFIVYQAQDCTFTSGVAWYYCSLILNRLTLILMASQKVRLSWFILLTEGSDICYCIDIRVPTSSFGSYCNETSTLQMEDKTEVFPAISPNLGLKLGVLKA